MTVPAGRSDGSGDSQAPAEPAADEPHRIVRSPDRATLERIFGVDAVSTRDDLPDPEHPRTKDDWYLENKPPHSG